MKESTEHLFYTMAFIILGVPLLCVFLYVLSAGPTNNYFGWIWALAASCVIIKALVSAIRSIPSRIKDSLKNRE
jgi:hypothetical protein